MLILWGGHWGGVKSTVVCVLDALEVVEEAFLKEVI